MKTQVEPHIHTHTHSACGLATQTHKGLFWVQCIMNDIYRHTPQTNRRPWPVYFHVSPPLPAIRWTFFKIHFIQVRLYFRPAGWKEVLQLNVTQFHYGCTGCRWFGGGQRSPCTAESCFVVPLFPLLFLCQVRSTLKKCFECIYSWVSRGVTCTSFPGTDIW